MYNENYNFSFENSPPVELMKTYLNFEFFDELVIITISVVSLDYNDLLLKEIVVYSSSR